MSDQHWLEFLADYYDDRESDIPQSRIDQLARVFSVEEPTVMRTAAEAWISEKTYFPQVANLRPFVEFARIESNRRASPAALSGEALETFDASILRWEQARGTMPSDQEIAEELARAAEELARVRSAP